MIWVLFPVYLSLLFAGSQSELSRNEVNEAVEEPKREDKFLPTTTPTITMITEKTTNAPQHSPQRAGAAGGDMGIMSVSSPMFVVIIAGCSVAGIVGIIVAGVCWYRFQKDVKAASEVEYPAYGVTGPNKERVQSSGDRKLAQSAQMYHYQHQKQQMIALEKANGEMKHDASDEDLEVENEAGDYTVYECPGLAPTGEMEVKNPLFSEDSNNGAPPTSAGPT